MCNPRAARRKRPSQPEKTSGDRLGVSDAPRQEISLGLIDQSPPRPTTLHRLLYTPARRSCITPSMVDAAGPMVGALNQESIALVMFQLLQIATTDRTASLDHGFMHAVYSAHTALARFSLTCKMVNDVLQSTAVKEFREMVAMMATSSMPSAYCWTKPYPFLKQLKEEHSSSRAAMVMGEALRNMATHCASAHCVMPRRGTNRQSAHGRIRVALDTSSRICTAGQHRLVVCTNKTEKRTTEGGHHPRHIEVVACDATPCNLNEAWQSRSDLVTRTLFDVADQSRLPSNVRIEQPEHVHVNRLAASHDGQHVLLELSALYAMADLSETHVQYSYVWIWSARGGGDDFNSPMMHTVDCTAFNGLYNGVDRNNRMRIPCTVFLEHFWFCEPCDESGRLLHPRPKLNRVKFCLYVTKPSWPFGRVESQIDTYGMTTGDSYGDLISHGSFGSDADTRQGSQAHLAPGYDRDFRSEKAHYHDWRTPGRAYPLLVSHQSDHRPRRGPIAVNASGELVAFWQMAAGGDSSSGTLAVADVRVDLWYNTADPLLNVETYAPRPDSVHAASNPSATRGFDGTASLWAISPIGDRLVTEVLPSDHKKPVLRLFRLVETLHTIRHSPYNQVRNADGTFPTSPDTHTHKRWELVASVGLLNPTKALVAQQFAATGPTGQVPVTSAMVFSPCGRLVLVISESANSQNQNEGRHVHVVDTDFSTGINRRMRQYATTTAACCCPRDVHWTQSGIWLKTNRGVLLLEPAQVLEQ